jgi:hypothetical protein
VLWISNATMSLSVHVYNAPAGIIVHDIGFDQLEVSIIARVSNGSSSATPYYIADLSPTADKLVVNPRFPLDVSERGCGAVSGGLFYLPCGCCALP